MLRRIKSESLLENERGGGWWWEVRCGIVVDFLTWYKASDIKGEEKEGRAWETEGPKTETSQPPQARRRGRASGVVDSKMRYSRAWKQRSEVRCVCSSAWSPVQVGSVEGRKGEKGNLSDIERFRTWWLTLSDIGGVREWGGGCYLEVTLDWEKYKTWGGRGRWGFLEGPMSDKVNSS